MLFLHFQVQIFLIVGIVLFLVAGIGSCHYISSEFTEVDNCKSKYDANNQNGKSFQCFKRYIAEPYFEKYESLVDSYFQDFLAREVPLGLCEVLRDIIQPGPRLSILHRYLVGEGSHRRLSTSIQFDINQDSISELPDHYCEAIIIEKLPSGVFADPFELQDLLHRGVFTEASVFGDTNLELPSIQSNRSLVEIHMDIGSNALSGKKNGMEINIELPLHARYPPLGENGFSIVEFGQPELFTHCTVEGKSHNQSCIFIATDSTDKSGSDGVVWEVPCGKREHTEAVSYVTFISATVSALLIILTSIYHSNIGCNSMKQS